MSLTKFFISLSFFLLLNLFWGRLTLIEAALPNQSENLDLELCSVQMQELETNSNTCTYFESIKDYRRCFFNLRRNQGRSLGNKSSYTTLGAVFFPSCCQNFYPFFDLRGHYFDNGTYAFNTGLGLRFKPVSFKQIFGFNIYYDHKRAYHSDFQQVGVGLESIGEFWNFRLNGYLPVGKKRALRSSCLFNKYVGNYFILRRDFASSLRGIDFELESLLADICCTKVYIAIGGYYYKGNKCKEYIYGTQYRLSIQPYDYLSLHLQATYDNVFKASIQGQVELTFACYSLNKDDNKLFQPVQRRETILIDKYSRWMKNF